MCVTETRNTVTWSRVCDVLLAARHTCGSSHCLPPGLQLEGSSSRRPCVQGPTTNSWRLAAWLGVSCASSFPPGSLQGLFLGLSPWPPEHHCWRGEARAGPRGAAACPPGFFVPDVGQRGWSAKRGLGGLGVALATRRLCRRGEAGLYFILSSVHWAPS